MSGVSRRDFFSMLGLGAAAVSLPGCCFDRVGTNAKKAKIALQLYSIRTYIAGLTDKNTKQVVLPGVGLEKTLNDVAAIGYKGVEFAGYYGYDARALRKMLNDAGLKACGTHVSREVFEPEKIKQTCEFNLAYGNNLIICPGGGNFPPGCSWGNQECPPSQEVDDFIKYLCDFYNKAAVEAAKYGCKIGIHNHRWEFYVKMLDGTTFWDYFFSNTASNVCMEQDVGWTTCAGADPIEQFEKFPFRSPTLHAKENGMGADVKEFDAILGQPGKPGAIPVDWDGVIAASEKAGVEWYVVECERHAEDLSAVLPSYDFLKMKGLN